MAERTLMVEVVYVGAAQAIRRRLGMAPGSTVMQAIETSGIIAWLPQAALDPSRLGIFSRRVCAGQLLQDGDRIEIYRGLQLDPMDARRRRAGRR